MPATRRSNKPADNVVPEVYSGDTIRSSWPFSTHQIRANIAHCSPATKEALVSAFLWCTDDKHPIHKSEFARRIGHAENTVYKWYAGKYRNAEGQQLDVPAKTVDKINDFLALERERAAGSRNEFVQTPTARKIWLACDLARESQTPVFVIGRSHVGKTIALQNYAAQHNHGRTVYCRMKAASGLGGMVRRIAQSVGVSPNSSTANLVDYIKHALTKDMVLILDEIHLLQYTYRISSFFACLEVVREIYDEVKCGMVLCGTQLLLDKINAGAKGELEQLMRRGVHRVQLPAMPTKADITAVLKRWDLDFPRRDMHAVVQGVDEQPYAVLRQLARHDGFLSITERLRYARKIAGKRSEHLNWLHFIEAHLTIVQQAQPEEDWS